MLSDLEVMLFAVLVIVCSPIKELCKLRSCPWMSTQLVDVVFDAIIPLNENLDSFFGCKH